MRKILLGLILSFLVASTSHAALTLTRQRIENSGSQTKMEYKIGFDSSYPTGGESLTAANVGLSFIERVKIMSDAGYLFEFDYTNNKVVTYTGSTPAGTINTPTFTGTSFSSNTLAFTDDNTAATNGTKLYFMSNNPGMGDLSGTGNFYSEMSVAADTYQDSAGLIGFVFFAPLDDETVYINHDATAETNGRALKIVPTGPCGKHSDCDVGRLTFISPTGASGTASLGTTLAIADTFSVYNDGTGFEGSALQVYFDEDATQGERLLVNNPTGKDMIFVAETGKPIHLNHSLTASTDGTTVYFDEDATDITQRLIFISPTSTDGTNTNATLGHYEDLHNVTTANLVYVDEDATNGQRLQTASGIDNRTYLISNDQDAQRRLVTLTSNASAATAGVQVYFNENEATQTLKMVYVSPTNASSTNLIDTNSLQFGVESAGSNSALTFTGSPSTLTEVVNATDLSSLNSVEVEIYGR